MDPQDQWLAQKYTWRIQLEYTSKRGQVPPLYVIANTHASEGRTHIIRLHRLITNAPDDMEVDHINGDPLDNRRENLRLVRHTENQQNRIGLNKKNTSGYRGVSWDSGRNRWRAYAQIAGKRNNIGRFADLHEAARAAYEWRLANMPGFIPENDPLCVDQVQCTR